MFELQRHEGHPEPLLALTSLQSEKSHHASQGHPDTRSQDHIGTVLFAASSDWPLPRFNLKDERHPRADVRPQGDFDRRGPMISATTTDSVESRLDAEVRAVSKRLIAGRTETKTLDPRLVEELLALDEADFLFDDVEFRQ